MLANVKNPFDVLRLCVGAVSMAFAPTVFLLLTYLVLLPFASSFIPAITGSIPYVFDKLTDWTGIDATPFNDNELFLTLSVRFIVLGTAVLTLSFLLKPPRRLVERSVAGDFTTSKIISPDWYFRVIVGCLLLGFLSGFFRTSSDRASADADYSFFTVVPALTALLLFIHGFLLYFLVGFWNIGCELVYPFLEPTADQK